MEPNKSTAGGRVFLITRKGKTSFSVSRVGKLSKGMSKKEILDVLRGLAPKKSTTAVAVTKTGAIRAAARARKGGGKNKTSNKLARLAAMVRGTVTLTNKKSKVSAAGKGKAKGKAKTSAKSKAKSSSGARLKGLPRNVTIRLSGKGKRTFKSSKAKTAKGKSKK